MSDSNFSGGKKPAKNFRNDRDNLNTKSGPFVGVVMDTYDSTNSGRIQVWLKTFGDAASKNDRTAWFSMRYLSPYYGVSPHQTHGNAADPDYLQNGHAYGMWFTTPDVGVEVLCMFAEDDPNQGFYMGFIPTQQMLHMVPAVGAQANPHYNNDAQKEKFKGAKRLPVTEIDRKTESVNDANFVKKAKPVHSVLAAQYWRQGLVSDQIRGPIGSSAQRESPSNVFGVNTPGRPIYAKGMFDADIAGKLKSGEVSDTTIVGRKGGHSFVMDDGDLEGNDNLIRIRTAGGHQIMMSDDGGTIYISHGSGNCWIELGAEGTIDGYAANSVNFRTGGDINLHADKSVNINALDNINLHAGKNITMQADKALTMLGKSKGILASEGKIEVKADAAVNIDAGTAMSVKAGAKLDLVGLTVGLNDPAAGKSVSAPKEFSLTKHTDVVTDDTVGWKQKDAKVDSVTSRLPTHEPYSGHGKGLPKSNVKPFE